MVPSRDAMVRGAVRGKQGSLINAQLISLDRCAVGATGGDKGGNQ